MNALLRARIFAQSCERKEKCHSKGQNGSLRGDCQSPQVPIDNRHAACQAAPQKNVCLRSRNSLARPSYCFTFGGL